MRRSEPDWVSGVRGRYEISPPIVHPPHCVCAICPRHRKTNEDWLRAFVIRARRKSPHPDNRLESAAFARNFKRQEESRLAEALQRAEAEKRARGNAVGFGRVCDVYRDRQQADGKRFDRDRYRINALEKFFGRDRDAQSIDRASYDAFRAHLTTRRLSASTILRYTATLVAMMNGAVRDGLIPAHGLAHLRRPSVKKKAKPVTFTRRQVGILLGRAIDQYEREQADEQRRFDVEQDRRRGEGLPLLTKKRPSVVPLRGFCFIAYLTLMRPENNFALKWSQIRLDVKDDAGRFRLDEHKNSSKGIEVEAALHPVLVRYLRQIAPGRGGSEYVHANVATGEPYRNIRQQWERLITIANTMLRPDEQMTGARAHFYTWRHTGASELAARGADPVMIVRMMGDSSLRTVMDHYFDSSVEHIQEVLSKWLDPTEDESQAGGTPNTWTN
jgi:integrase